MASIKLFEASKFVKVLAIGGKILTNAAARMPEIAWTAINVFIRTWPALILVPGLSNVA